MNTRIKDLAERREELISVSEDERERVAHCLETVTGFMSGDSIGRAMKSSVGTVAGVLTLRWAGKKLVGFLTRWVGRRLFRRTSTFWGGARARQRL